MKFLDQFVLCLPPELTLLHFHVWLLRLEHFPDGYYGRNCPLGILSLKQKLKYSKSHEEVCFVTLTAQFYQFRKFK